MSERRMITIEITEREAQLVQEGLDMLYQDACEDADEGRATEIDALQDTIQALIGREG